MSKSQFQEQNQVKRETKKDKDETRHRKTSMRLCFNCGYKGHLSNECPDKAKGPKCFVCSGYGHVSTKCPEENNRSGSSNMTLVEVVPRNSVKLNIDDIQMIALSDTENDITAIRQDVYEAYFKDIDLNGESVTLRGIGSDRVATMGFFERNVFINEEELVLKIHVIPCETSNFKAIVGNDILARVDVVFRDGGIVVFKKERHNFFWTITLDEEANKETEIVDVIHIKNEENRKEGGGTELHTDASKYGYGACLLQKSNEDGRFHPVHYMGKKTTPAEKKYSSYELEVLAVIQAVKKFRIYLLGIHFKIITDCSAFHKTMAEKDLTTRVPRWALLLEEYSYGIEHRKGNKMSHVDALSRHPNVMTMTLTEEDGVVERLRRAQELDEHILTIKKILSTEDYEDFFVKSDILYKFVNGRELIVVPKMMQTDIMKKAHEIGHFALPKTEEVVNRKFSIPKLKEKCLGNCIHCILAIVDDFSKFTWLYACKSTTTKKVIDCLEKQKQVFGNPSRIITYRGTAFTAEEFKNYCFDEGIQNLTITTGIPRGNGQVERVNLIIIPVLTKLSLEDPGRWFKYVERVQRALNSTTQRSIGTSPFEILTGVKMRNKEKVLIKESLEEATIQKFNENREDLRAESKKQILKVQEENGRTYNLRRRKPRIYKKGDLVAINGTQFGVGIKIQRKFLGPYEVTKMKPNDRYDVVKFLPVGTDSVSYTVHIISVIEIFGAVDVLRKTCLSEIN
ncbi:hypothetical protein JTB14_034224 [Gonioctena quinquepunctata]|nr:hypothetical protein JTB14_034224 [Gonioctena quinquepunctata]